MRLYLNLRLRRGILPLKTIEIKKLKSSGKTKRIKVPTLHLGHIGKNAADRESLYKEYLNHLSP